MTFAYTQAATMVQRAQQHPLLPLCAFVPQNHPILTARECEELSDATDYDLRAIMASFSKEHDNAEIPKV
jgi:hypothetical protein